MMSWRREDEKEDKWALMQELDAASALGHLLRVSSGSHSHK
jgi:hypothetical protein